MPLILPSSPAPRSMTWRPLSARGENRPAFGGPLQRPERTGTRSAFDVELPPMSYTQAMAWMAALSVEADTVVMDIHQPGFSTGSPGSSLVNGAGQLGSTLNVDGMTNGYTLKAGQWFSVIISSQRFAYMVASDVVVSGGAAAIPLRQMIRRSPANNAVVEIAAPKVEGFPDFGGAPVTPDRLVHGLRFTIEETE